MAIRGKVSYHTTGSFLTQPDTMSSTTNLYSLHMKSRRFLSFFLYQQLRFLLKDKAQSICHLLQSTGHAMYITNSCIRRVKYDIKTIIAKVHLNNSNKLMCNSNVITLTQWLHTNSYTMAYNSLCHSHQGKASTSRFLLQYNHVVWALSLSLSHTLTIQSQGTSNGLTVYCTLSSAFVYL